MISSSLRKKFNKAGDFIACCIGVIVLIHLFAGSLIVLSAFGKLVFFELIEFWNFFYDFFANGLVFPSDSHE